MCKYDEDRKLVRRAKEQKISTDEVYSQMGHHGVFVIFSSRKIVVDKLLPTEPIKKMNDCYRLFKIKCHVEIP